MPVTETQPEKKAAPGRLELVRAFINSVDYFDAEEDLAGPGALGRWLAERGLLAEGYSPSEAEFRRAIDVREGLRAVLLSHNGDELDEAAVGRLDRAAAKATRGRALQASSRAWSRARRESTARWPNCWHSWPTRGPTAPGTG